MFVLAQSSRSCSLWQYLQLAMLASVRREQVSDLCEDVVGGPGVEDCSLEASSKLEPGFGSRVVPAICSLNPITKCTAPPHPGTIHISPLLAAQAFVVFTAIVMICMQSWSFRLAQVDRAVGRFVLARIVPSQVDTFHMRRRFTISDADWTLVNFKHSRA